MDADQVWAFTRSEGQSNALALLHVRLGLVRIVDANGEQFFAAVLNDSQWMDERIEKNRAKWKAKKARQRVTGE